MQIEDKKIYGEVYWLSFPNGNYIGQTTQGEKIRWKEHLKNTRNGSKLAVHNAIRKYYNKDETINKVKRKVIDMAYSLEELNNLEQKYIFEYNTFNECGKNPCGYNLNIGGDGNSGYKFTEQQKEICRQREQKRKEEHPEFAINHGIIMKQFHKDNPHIAVNHSIHMKQLYIDEPDRKENMSILKACQYKNNPEMAMQQRELKLMFYEDKNAFEFINNSRNKSVQQWKNPELKQKIMDEKRKRFSKPFNVYKDGILIDMFDYIPDCAFKLFGIKYDGNLSAAVNGRRKNYKGYTFEVIS